MCETHALRVTIQRFLLLKISSRMESSAVVALALLPPFARTIKSKRKGFSSPFRRISYAGAKKNGIYNSYRRLDRYGIHYGHEDRKPRSRKEVIPSRFPHYI
ncbi:hypothetical protein RHMOL_Rhmol06G0087300 [Rhododendron molle]|uniref:Uncharacterized protein n=1 Tax=Rhododendron molle TaxID=49168 RepID=A0ACC0NAV2_RHOML|nr:hypothetical protein RHMOL_Rhmol06G0087300 [Rhododendron molle]